MPTSKAVNDYSKEQKHQIFAWVDDAAALVADGCYMSKIYLFVAYRAVVISKHGQNVIGLKWQFGAKTVCLGSRMAPGIFILNSGSLTCVLTKGTQSKLYILMILSFQECLPKCIKSSDSSSAQT